MGGPGRALGVLGNPFGGSGGGWRSHGGIREGPGDALGTPRGCGGAGCFGGGPEGALGVFGAHLRQLGRSWGCLRALWKNVTDGWPGRVLGEPLGVFGGYLFGVPRLRRRLRLPAVAEAAALSQSGCGCCPPRFLSGCQFPPAGVSSQSGARLFPPLAPSVALPPLPNGGAHGPRLRR